MADSFIRVLSLYAAPIIFFSFTSPSYFTSSISGMVSMIKRKKPSHSGPENAVEFSKERFFFETLVSKPEVRTVTDIRIFWHSQQRFADGGLTKWWPYPTFFSWRSYSAFTEFQFGRKEFFAGIRKVE